MKTKNTLGILNILFVALLQPVLSKATTPITFTVTVSAYTNACNGSGNGSATATASNGNTPYTYSWSPAGGNGSTASGLSAGTYTITAYDNLSNSATASVTILQSSVIVPTAMVTTPILCYGGTGSATANPTGGVSPYTYSWSSGGGTNATMNSFSVSGTTTYTTYGAYPTFTVPAGITQLSITISGAAGGLGSNGPNENGGDGVGFTGVVSVIPGHVLGIIVGQAGSVSTDAGAGGGGASYVWDESNTTLPLAIAAGGGGGGLTSAGAAGGTNLTSNAATAASANTAAGGTGGNGGAAGSGLANDGAGGAGWLSNGGNGNGASGGNDMASGFLDGIGAYNGGWGGGGGGSSNGGGGGGGGYNGGGGGLYADNSGTYIYGGGGGGGSYFNTAYGTLPGTVRANNTGNGSVSIHYSASGGSGIPIGTYSVTVTDNNGCTATASVTLSQPALLTTSASVIANACYGINNGNASATPSGGVSPYTYSWSNGTTTSSTGTVLSGGTYTVSVQDNNSCSVTASVIITQPSQSLTATASPITGACNGTSNGNASVNPSGGALPYTYSWSNGITNSATGSVLSVGTYTVTVLDGCGSSATASVIINQSSVITATTSVINPIMCYGASNGSATVGVAGGISPYTYSWGSNGGTTSTINSYNTSGTTTFTVVGAEQTFTVPAGVTQVSITLTGGQGGYGGGGGGSAGAESGGKGAGFTGIASVTPGHVLYVVTGGIGGPGNTGGDGGGGGGGGSYVWDKSANILLAAAGGGGGGSFTTKGGAGGTNLTTNASIDGSGGNAASGTGGNGGAVVNANGNGAGGAGWYSNGGSITGSGAAGGGGNYASSFAVGLGDAANGDGGYGGGGGGGVTGGGGGGGYNGGGGGDVGGGGGGGSYFNTAYGTLPGSVTAINTGNGFASIGYSVTSNSGVAAGTYSVTVTDANGCTATASVTLTEPAILSTSTSVIAYTCNSSSTGNVMAVPSGGTSPYTYSWSNGATTNPTGATLSEGTYTVTVKDACGSSAAASVVISQPPALSATASVVSNITCGGNNGNASASPSGGAAPYTYSWSGGATTNPTGTVLSVGTYTVTVTDNCGSTATTSVTIAGPNGLSATASVTNNSCPGSNTGGALASPSGGTSPYTYSWSPAGGTSAAGTGLSAGTYTVTVQDNCGASATASVSISQSIALSTTASIVTNVNCNGESTGSASASPSNGTSPYTYSWSPGGETISTASGLSAGTYTVTVSDQCSNSATASVNITEPSAMSIRGDSSSGNGKNSGVASVTVSGGKSPYTYSWITGGQTTSRITGQSEGTYCCVITDNNGCAYTTCITIPSPTGIDNISNSSSVNIYPDPNTGYFTITGVIQGQIVELYDYTGRKIADEYAQAGTAIHFDISAKADGIYLLRIVNQDGSLVTEKKIVKTQ